MASPTCWVHRGQKRSPRRFVQVSDVACTPLGNTADKAAPLLSHLEQGSQPRCQSSGRNTALPPIGGAPESRMRAKAAVALPRPYGGPHLEGNFGQTSARDE